MAHSTIQNHTSYNATYVCQHDREQRRNKRAHVCLNAHDLPTFLLNCTARIHIKGTTVPTDTLHIAQVREYSARQHYAYSR